MWLYEAANQAAKTAKERVVQVQEKVQEKASIIVAQVQDEAQTLLNSMSLQQDNPVDEIIFEELDDYKAFQDVFDLDDKTEDVAAILKDDTYISDLHTAMVPEQLSYKEFWTRYYFREFTKQRQEEERAKREEARRAQLLEEQAAREERERDARIAYEARMEEERLAAEAAEDVAMWKEQVDHLQQVIRSLEHSEQDKYKALSDDYESKMTQMTLQIDDAKASGYEEGIAESEAIVAKLRAEAQAERDELRAFLEHVINPSTAAMPEVPASSVLSLETAQHLWALRQSGPPTTTDAQHAKELDLWKARAMKMKKLKDDVDAELVTAKAAIASAEANGFAAGEAAAKETYVAQIQALEAALAAHQQTTLPALPLAAEVQDAAEAKEPTRDDWGEWD
ncbi:hypothetical protein SPRG_01164 [Saprolegnia parasitica CBS 223.65]|uniref:BSD domain-containing protein n=1 Tax=Saprolegnia parasitica (strain CBS 223.65) TaxID=695850 RepID=A0A067CX73_SAPPC|nr:hypothetical protein SPRG_01164 [Saprolegnia parasitica CBS 223.65]KDO35098.1 hypothetical protein SPRG_01164 [Saprolegnia parasitica CBS 223.65]|eukprot:XP_012194748.1 hypothetical protein SPRG_01164 [Saprolegnia parasitica CBS 223.65]